MSATPLTSAMNVRFGLVAMIAACSTLPFAMAWRTPISMLHAIAQLSISVGVFVILFVPWLLAWAGPGDFDVVKIELAQDVDGKARKLVTVGGQLS
ncbi:hypothetical protein [Sulfitobacter pontiacus]|uniref:hypothetical protein n=1 Tax=Sulfitobacter pontiacus TaxID=60137 RepID=UPI0015DEFDCF|nr:hypothetical protein [Sulfitobacter pontiacus]QLL42823.1 hypothetical protein G6548_09880 [Sulfitobacter pontiacus]